MKIEGPKLGGLQGGQKVQDRQESLEERRSLSRGGGDRVELSMQREMTGLKAMAMEAPVDEMSLEELQEAIREGTYQPDLGGLQERILAQPSLLNDLLDP